MVKKPEQRTEKIAEQEADRPECFVIMPISDPEGYAKGHFQRVYRDIFRRACKAAGYRAIRADDVAQTNLIQEDILRRLLKAPMALCDLSALRPNVLFELGLRQAFEMPVVLVAEEGTPNLFDIGPLRYTPYRPTRLFHEVVRDYKRIATALRATEEACKNGEGFNSLVKLLALPGPASLPEIQDTSRDPGVQVIRAELSELRAEIRRLAAHPLSASGAHGGFEVGEHVRFRVRRAILIRVRDAACPVEELVQNIASRFAVPTEVVAIELHDLIGRGKIRMTSSGMCTSVEMRELRDGSAQTGQT
jgi:hypothetical protein